MNKKKEEVDIMTTDVEYDKTVILSNLEESLKEMKLMREGKKKKRSWNDLKKIMTELTKEE